MDDFYDLLEVPENASHDDIKAAWREKAREYHPDVNDDDRATAQFKTLRKAYEVLSDETERSAYDRMGHANYVSKRLDGLPTAGMTRPSSGSGGNRWQTASRSPGGGRTASSGAASASASNRGSASRSSSSRSSSSQSSSGRSSSSRSSSSRSSSSRTSSGTSSSRASSSRSSTRSSRSSSRSSRTSTSSTRSSASSASGNRSSRSSRSRSRRSSGGSSGGRTSRSRTRTETRGEGTEGSASSASEAATADEESARSPLWYGWTAVFLAGVAYAAGLAVYLRSNLGALSSLAASAASDPAAAVTASHGLTPPGAFVLGTVAAPPSAGLAFPVGAGVLAVVFAATVAKFGRGTAYLYLVGAFAPLGAFSFGTAVAVAPAGATLALLVVLPLAATLLFLGDVGRFLISDR